MNESTEEIIQRAISEAKAGNKEAARKSLTQAVRQEPSNAHVWYLLGQIVDKVDQKIYCLEQVLKIQPDNVQAKEKLAKLKSISDELSLGNLVYQNQSSHQPRNKNRYQPVIFGCLGTLLFLIILIIGGIMIYSNQDNLAFIFEPTHTPQPTYTRYPTYTPQRAVIPIIIPTSSIPTFKPVVIPTMTSTATDIPTTTPHIIEQTQKLGPILNTTRDESYSAQITVQNVRYSSGGEFNKPRKDYIFAIVQVMIVNLGPNAIRSIGPYDFQIRDSNGALRDYDYVSETNECKLDTVDLSANGVISGCIGYEVPANGQLEFIFAPYKYEGLTPGRFLSFIIRY